jgi:hypothetical protein
MKSVAGERAGEHFIAITDPGTQLVDEAKRDHFRTTFLNLPDIGGRYSALSFFGLVPMALAGVDIITLLDRARHAAHVSSLPQIRKNPAALLGTVLGAMAQQGRNKLTLIAPRPLDTLGLWVEQLIAESTGKEGKGIVPVAGEPALAPNAYGNDRLFVCVRMRGSDETARLRELAAAGHPVVDLVLEDPLDLGETFFVWEFATAVAGAILGVDTFDQPNVQESKDNTKRILGEIAGGTAPSSQDVHRAGDDAALAALLAQVQPGDYFAITEYFAETAERDAAIARIRETIARELHVATTTGYGPRFLHSTGQLHKGGPATGVFLQLVASARDIEIPDENLTFGQLIGAQALGDAQSLATRHRRMLRIDLGDDVEQGLAWVEKSVAQALAQINGKVKA